MGMMRVIVQDENGEQLGEGIDFPTSTPLFSRADPGPLGLLGFIDPYGDTVFNRLQIPVLMSNLRTVAAQGDAQVEAILPRIEQLAAEALKEPHCYIKFIGD